MEVEVIVTTLPNPYNPLREWDWVVRCYYADGRLAIETVHKGDSSRDMEIEAAKRCPKFRTIKVLTWDEAGRPKPKTKR